MNKALQQSDLAQFSSTCLEGRITLFGTASLGGESFPVALAVANLTFQRVSCARPPQPLVTQWD